MFYFNAHNKNNRIENLRECLHNENHQNIGTQLNSTSGYTGVGWHKARKKWRAHITHNRKHIHLGLFDTKEAAYSAYLNAKAKYHLFQPTPRGWIMPLAP